MKYGEQFESSLVDRFTGQRNNHTAVYRYASWKQFHTNNYGEGLWDGDRQIVGTCDFTVAGCKTEKAAVAKIRKYIKESEEE